MKNIPLFKKADILLIILVLISSIIFICYLLIPNDQKLTAYVEKDGVQILTVDLSDITKAYDYNVPGDIPVTIQFGNGYALIKSSGCEDKICVNTGKLDKPDQSAVCLPARVAVYIKGSNNISTDIPDAITG